MSSAQPKKVWTILDLITWGTGYLGEKGIEEARLTIELLLAHLLSLKRINLYMNFDRPLGEDELASFKAMLKRRLAGEPLQYITGSTEFMGKTFRVDQRVLIPRPETELLTEACVKFVKSTFPDQEIAILDLGTGSGCIAVALAVMLPNARVTAADVSAEALAVAQLNAEMNNVADRVTFLPFDLLTGDAASLPGPFHAVVSNPPYVSQTEYAQLDATVKDHEPSIALTDGKDGLTMYPSILTIAEQHLLPGGFVGVEHQFDQSDSVRMIFTAHGFPQNDVITDYNGIRRHVIARKAGE